jgi:hypothetical protein
MNLYFANYAVDVKFVFVRRFTKCAIDQHVAVLKQFVTGITPTVGQIRC